MQSDKIIEMPYRWQMHSQPLPPDDALSIIKHFAGNILLYRDRRESYTILDLLEGKREPFVGVFDELLHQVKERKNA